MNNKKREQITEHFHHFIENILARYSAQQNLLVKRHQFQHLQHSSKTYHHELMINNQYFINTVYKQIPIHQLKLTFTNALINQEIIDKKELIQMFQKKINDLKSLKNGKSNKNLAKAHNLERLIKPYQHNTGFGDTAVEWFKRPTGKRIKVISSADTLNLLEELDECTGSAPLPSELLTYQYGGRP